MRPGHSPSKKSPAIPSGKAMPTRPSATKMTAPASAAVPAEVFSTRAATLGSVFVKALSAHSNKTRAAMPRRTLAMIT